MTFIIVHKSQGRQKWFWNCSTKTKYKEKEILLYGKRCFWLLSSQIYLQVRDLYMLDLIRETFSVNWTCCVWHNTGNTNNEVERFMTTANKSAVRIGEKNNGETHQRSTVTYTHVFLSEPIYSLCSHQTLFKPFLTSFSRSYKIKNEMRILMSNSIPQCYRICVKISINSRRKKL